MDMYVYCLSMFLTDLHKIFQIGFGLLESGSVSSRNEVNVMAKNTADILFGGISYWVFGYAFCYGKHPKLSNPFIGWGNFFMGLDGDEKGPAYAKFFFQASFATTATTIVSGEFKYHFPFCTSETSFKQLIQNNHKRRLQRILLC